MKIVFAFLLLALSLYKVVFAASLTDEKSRRLSKKYSSIFNQKGYDFKVLGSSTKNSTFSYELSRDYEKVLLIWSGESAGVPSEHKNINLKLNDKIIKVKAKHFYENYTQGKLFLAVAELRLKKGTYTIKLAGKTKPNPKYYGHAMVLLEKQKSENRVKIFAGLEAFYPGSLHGVDLKAKSAPFKIAVIGGHGLKGNGSTNLINGKPLGRGDDWNGSSGERWDIDQYYITVEKQKEIVGKKIVFEVDPLLQWLFPLVIIGSWEG
jgi:hypothetical protein